MEKYFIIGGIVLVVFLIASAIGMLCATMPIAKKQYTNQFVRTSQEKWKRANSAPENEDHCRMYDQGIAWANTVAEYRKEVSVTSEGLRLVGELFDFGYDKTAIILSGRAEALEYSYFFAKPYHELGYNILAIDGRAHGLSEGVYGTAGIREQYDIQEWMKLLAKDYGTKKVVIHGLCIGSATAIYVAGSKEIHAVAAGATTTVAGATTTAEGATTTAAGATTTAAGATTTVASATTTVAGELPALEAIVLEGPFISFYNVLKARIRTAGHPTFPVALEMAWLFRAWADADIFKYAPVKRVKKVKVPTLFLCGKEDISSLPQYCKHLYANCAGEKKKLVWFEHGAHSHLRIANPQMYDDSIKEFMQALWN